MTFQLVTGEVKDPNDKAGLAKVVFDFFLWQYEQAIREEISARCNYNACVAANEAAQREFATNPDWGGGMGASLPYQKHYVELKEREASQTKKSLAEAKILLNFVKDELLRNYGEMTKKKG
jgi:hypothetical protein